MSDEERREGSLAGIPAIEVANLTRHSIRNQHCATCDCYDISALGLLDVRTRILLRRLHRKDFKLTIPNSVIARLNMQAPRYCFGFTGWKCDYSTTRMAGQFLVALKCAGDREYRFLVVSTVSMQQMWLHLPGRPKPDNVFTVEPRADEYIKGDAFNISAAPFTEELLTWAGSAGDDELEAYLLAHLRPLVELATKITAELDATDAANAKESKDNG